MGGHHLVNQFIQLTMAWDANVYNKFKAERFQPFYDCLNLLERRQMLDVLDLGCGTGELTRKLANELPVAKEVLGIDSSADMLVNVDTYGSETVRFQNNSIESQLGEDRNWDLIFSHAALQWVPDHKSLFSKIITRLKPGGQLLVQMPAQRHNATNQLLAALANEEPFRTLLNAKVPQSPVLDINEYAEIFFNGGGTNINNFEKIYPVIVDNADALFEWVAGTALIPYRELLGATHEAAFIRHFKHALGERFPGSPVFYPFRRIVLSAIFPGK
jgi:trans-aconitate 2-methyltransferase